MHWETCLIIKNGTMEMSFFLNDRLIFRNWFCSCNTFPHCITKHNWPEKSLISDFGEHVYGYTGFLDLTCFLDLYFRMCSCQLFYLHHTRAWLVTLVLIDSPTNDINFQEVNSLFSLWPKLAIQWYTRRHLAVYMGMKVLCSLPL